MNKIEQRKLFGDDFKDKIEKNKVKPIRVTILNESNKAITLSKKDVRLPYLNADELWYIFNKKFEFKGCVEVFGCLWAGCVGLYCILIGGILFPWTWEIGATLVGLGLLLEMGTFITATNISNSKKINKPVRDIITGNWDSQNNIQIYPHEKTEEIFFIKESDLQTTKSLRIKTGSNSKLEFLVKLKKEKNVSIDNP